MAGPGHLKHNGRGDLVIGSPLRELNEKIKTWFEAAQVPVVVSENVAGELWAKLVVNCAYNALSAITQLPYGKLIQGNGIREVMRDVVEETLAVAKAGGVTMAPDMLAKTWNIAEAMPTQYSSTAQDLARGRPTEIDHLNGFVLRKGEALGIPTPANRALYALVKLIEGKPRTNS
jgi:2-dehydropantoate 2-reductase